MTNTKAVSVLTADIKAATTSDGTYDITLSVPVEDRDGEVVDAKAFEPLPDWLNIDVDHGMSVLTTVGSGRPEYDGDTLKLRGFSFASTALGQDVKTLVDEGHIRKMSVAFMAAEREKDQKDSKVHIRRAELLNAAVVAIPSNREADILIAGKSLAAKMSRDARGVKAIAGSYEDRADRLRQALRAANPAAEWLWIRATFDDSVVYETEDAQGQVMTWQSTYTVDGGSFTFGDPVEVDLAEVIVPPVKSATLTGDDATAPDPEKAAAPAAASPATGAVAKARVFTMQAAQTLAHLSA